MVMVCYMGNLAPCYIVNGGSGEPLAKQGGTNSPRLGAAEGSAARSSVCHLVVGLWRRMGPRGGSQGAAAPGAHARLCWPASASPLAHVLLAGPRSLPHGGLGLIQS